MIISGTAVGSRCYNVFLVFKKEGFLFLGGRSEGGRGWWASIPPPPNNLSLDHKNDITINNNSLACFVLG